MANFTVSRDKNFLMFLLEGKSNPYKFDINTCTFYGLSGKEIKNCPNNIPSFLGGYYTINFRNNNDNVDQILMFLGRQEINFGVHSFSRDDVKIACRTIDRLNSIGFKKAWDMRIDDLNTISKNFKKFSKWYKENPEENYNINDFLNYEYKKSWLETFKITPSEHLPEWMIDEVWRILKRNDSFKKYSDYILYYLSHGLADFFGIVEFNGSQYDIDINNDRYSYALNFIKEYFSMCEEMEEKPVKEDFFRLLVNTRRKYTLLKSGLDAKKIAPFYEKHPCLAFEDEKYKVILPKTEEDFLAEAKGQKNCVHAYYYKNVVDNQKYIVFIRLKDNLSKTYITCEVNLKGKIVQALRTCNSRITDTEDKNFLETYKKHLAENW